MKIGVWLPVAALLLAGVAARAGSDARVFIATYLDEQPSHAPAAASMIAAYARQLRGKQGSLEVRVLQEVGRPGRFVLLESWADAASRRNGAGLDEAAGLPARLRTVQRSPQDQRIHHVFDAEASSSATLPDAIYVVTHLDVPAARRSEAEGLLQAFVAGTRAQRGCERFDIYQQDEPRQNHFTLLSVWTHRATFDAYGGSAVWQQFMGDITPLLGAPLDERIYHRVAG